MGLIFAAPAAATPVWEVASVAPSTTPPGHTLHYYVQLANTGDTPANGNEETGGSKIELVATLPAGLKGVSAEASGLECPSVAGASVIVCTSGEEVTPHAGLFGPRLDLAVEVESGASGVETARFDVSGGGAAPANTVDPTKVTEVAPEFGVDAFDGQLTSDVGGDPFSQAGGHPYAISTSIDFNTFDSENRYKGVIWPVEPVKDVLVDLPPGLIGNPTAAPRCVATDLANTVAYADPRPLCPSASQVGIAVLRDNGFGVSGVPSAWGPVPVFNLVPPPGVPARFGFNLLGVMVVLDASLRSDGDYGLTIGGRDISEGLAIAGTTLTFWGVPADASHDDERACPGELNPWLGGRTCPGGVAPRAFLRTPTACTAPGEGLVTTLRTDSWTNPGLFREASYTTHTPPGFPAVPGEWGATLPFSGCESVPFTPAISVQPTSHAPDAPSGLGVTLSIPQDALTVPAAIAQADLRKAVVTLPEGMAVNPSSADGLGACSPAEIGLGSTADPSCPDSSKLGTVSIDTPLLEDPLVGSIYLAKQNDNPFGSLLAVYLVAKGSGIVIKLAGKIDADPATGRLTASFDNTPQLPFSTLKLAFRNGPRAPLVTPASCGEKSITSELTGWNGKTVTLSSPYAVDCPAGLGGFTPGFQAGTTNPQAGGFSPFSMTLTRADGQQSLGAIKLQMPPGLLGVLKSVPLCGEAQAAAGSCGAESLIGHTTVGAGAGSNPFYLGGQVFLTGPYKGAPFGLSIVVPAVAGPFNLGTVVVRASIAVDPHTAQLTITSDPLPTILQGIPLDLRVVNVTVDRDAFTFNPTNCEAQSIVGTVTSSQGASVTGQEHFQAANCAALPFAPRFSASSLAKTSRNNGAALDVKVGYPSGAQANIHSVAVTLPKQLPARLSTIQLACPAATFEANPASCGEGSMVGVATASTPILASPLTGPAYLVSHGGESFPDIVLVLQSQGIRIDLVGNVFITKTGITSATFAHVPDAPISGFDLNLPLGPHSALSAVGSLCTGALNMPTTITGQNGAQIKQTTRIKVTGCPKAKKKKPKKHRKKHKAKKGNAARRS